MPFFNCSICLSYCDFCLDIVVFSHFLWGPSLGGGCLVVLVHTSVILEGAALQGMLNTSDIFCSAVKPQVITFKEDSG